MTTLNNLLPDYPMLYVLFLFLLKTTATTLNNSFVEKILSEFVCIVSCLLKTTTTSFLPAILCYIMGLYQRRDVQHGMSICHHLSCFFTIINPRNPCPLTPFIVILLFDVVLLNYPHICTMRHNFLLFSKFRFVQMLCR